MHQRVRMVIGFCAFILRRFIENRGANTAAALTYTTLFAVVPMMTVTFSMLSAIPAFQGSGEQVQRFIFSNFVPSAGETLQQYLSGFTEQARQLTWIGVAVLAATAFLMLVTIEKAFNTIWRVRQPRRGVSSFLLYWAILSLGPLLLGGGFAVSTYITSLSILSGPDALIGSKTLLQFMPLLSSVAAFTLLYATVPNARVPLRNACLGGLFAAILFELAKMLFGLYVQLFPSYQLVYGAFATVPLFLLWIYLSWLIVLLGAELACNMGRSWQWRTRAVAPLLAALGALRVFYDFQQQGRAVRLQDIRQNGWPMTESEWEELLDFFKHQQLVACSGAGAWVLCRDLQHYSLQQLLLDCPWPLPKAEQLLEPVDEPWYASLKEGLQQLNETQAGLFSRSLASYLRAQQPD